MRQFNTVADQLRARQASADYLQATLHDTLPSMIDEAAIQASTSRLLFEQAIARPAVDLVAVTAEQAAQLQADLQPTLAADYSWLGQMDASTLAAHMTAVNEVRNQFYATHGKQLSGGHVYRHFRLLLERAGEGDVAAHEHVVVIEALLGGAIIDGELPF